MRTPAHRFQVPRAPPNGVPILEPSEAVAIALSTGQLGREYGPDSQLVRHVLRAIEKCGWEIVPKVPLR